MKSDSELLAAYLGGSEEAFGEFYRRHRRALYVYLLSFVRNRATAEELLQETLLTFLRKIDHLNGAADLRPWLLRLARNRALDFLRRERRAGEALRVRGGDPWFRSRRAGDGVTTAGFDPEEVERLLLRLPPEQREVVLLRALLDLSFGDIAALTGVSENTVVSRYRYGTSKLRSVMEPAIRQGDSAGDSMERRVR